MAKSLPPLLVALVGAGVVYLMFKVSPAALAVLVIPMAIGLIAWWRARELVSGKKPVESLRWFGASQLVLYTLAAAAAAALIYVAVLLAPPEKPDATPGTPAPPADPFDPYLKEILKALSGAAAAFITAAWVKPAEDGDSWVGNQTKSAFQSTFVPLFKDETAGARAVRRDGTWDRAERLERAAAIAAALKDPTQLR